MLLYRIFINIIVIFLPVGSLFSKTIREYIRLRKAAQKNYTYPSDDKKSIWFHSASYGEYEGIAPLIKHFKNESQRHIVNTFFSPSGFENLKDKNPYTYYLPFDKTQEINAFIDHTLPQLLVISQNDYWPNLVSICHKRGIQVLYVSTYLKPKHWWLRSISKLLVKPLKRVDKIFMQDGNSVSYAKERGFDNVVLNGNTRVDRVIQSVQQAKEYPFLKQFSLGGQVLVAGSVLESDIAVLQFIKSQFRLLIVPHDLDSTFLNEIMDHFPNAIRYSEINESLEVNVNHVVLDTIGDLKYVYRYANLAYVGGGFDKGPHSYLEPLAWKIPVITGPNIQKFPDAIDLHKQGLLHVVGEDGDMIAKSKSLANGFSQQELDKLEAFFSLHKGATDKIISHIEKLIRD